MHPAAIEAANEIESQITGDTPADLASTIRHAASVAIRFPCEKRTLRQLRQHARFHEANEPKAKAYTTAADIFARLTGATLDRPLPDTVTRLHLSFTEFDLGILPGFAAAAS